MIEGGGGERAPGGNDRKKIRRGRGLVTKLDAERGASIRSGQEGSREQHQPVKKEPVQRKRHEKKSAVQGGAGSNRQRRALSGNSCMKTGGARDYLGGWFTRGERRERLLEFNVHIQRDGGAGPVSVLPGEVGKEEEDNPNSRRQWQSRGHQGEGHVAGKKKNDA